MSARSRACWLLAALALAASKAAATDVGGNYEIYGLGSESCSQFLSSIEHALTTDRDRERRFAYLSWVQGYLTRYNVENDDTFSIVGTLDVPPLEKWLTGYCNQHPTDTVAVAALKLAKDLYARRKSTK